MAVNQIAPITSPIVSVFMLCTLRLCSLLVVQDYAGTGAMSTLEPQEKHVGNGSR